jgi:pimeloyl-ACP methyl ester carboxylesterase
LKVKYVSRKYNTGVWCYAEKGTRTCNKPTFVFVHGIGGGKDDWPSIIKRIPAAYHCIVVDLPGHGETTFLHDYDEPTVSSYSLAFREFLEILDLHKKNQIFLIGYVFFYVFTI